MIFNPFAPMASVSSDMPGVFCAMMIGVFVLLPQMDPAPLAGQAVIEDPVACERCTIELTAITRIGDFDGPGALPGAPGWVEVDAQERIWLLYGDQPPLVFDPAGEFVQRVGRMGPGPGEFQFPRGLARAADSMLVYDRGGRIVVVGPDLSPARSIRMGALRLVDIEVLEWPHSVFVNGAAGLAGSAQRFLHVLDLGGDEAHIVRTFGESGGALLAGESSRKNDRHLTLATDGGVWTLRRVSEYALAHWNPDGTPGDAVVRRSELFPEGFDGLGGGPEVEPSPRLRGLHQDSESLLWVAGEIPRADWRDAWTEAGIEEAPRSPTEMPSTAMPSAFDLRESVLEVLDPETRTVVAREVLDFPILGFLPGDRMVTYRVTDAGVPVVEIMHFELAGTR